MGKIRECFEGRDSADRLNRGVREDYWMTEQTDNGHCHSPSWRGLGEGQVGGTEVERRRRVVSWKCFVCDAYGTYNKLEIRAQI